MSREDRERWEKAHHERAGSSLEPAGFLREHADLLVPGRALDLACGSGRNAVFLARRGLAVLAVDGARRALHSVRESAAAIDLVQMDLDRPGIRAVSIDDVVCVNFLDRRLFSEIHRWLRPGGVLLLDTFLVDQRALGHPKNPAYLLEHNELLERLSGDYRILRYREGKFVDGGVESFRAGAVAVKLIRPARPA